MSMIVTSSYSNPLAAAQNSHHYQHRRHLPTSSSQNSNSSSSSTSSSSPIIIIGYAHNAKSGKAEQAILDGINVIIWSFVHLDVTEEYVTTVTQKQQQQKQEQSIQQHQVDDSNTKALPKHQQLVRVAGKIRTDLDLEEIRNIRNKYDHVVHLAALGGWNGPHPPPHIMSGKEWCHVFLTFNQANGYLFDGVDWDYEGHDDVTSPTAQFSLETLDIVADFSVEAKRQGLIVSMAPAESYLDSTIQPACVMDAQFSLSLHLPPRAWTSSPFASDDDREIVASNLFSHSGRQCYAYILARAGIETFDWISVQLYESYSPFSHDVHRRSLDPVDALMMRLHGLVAEGYTVTDLPLSSSSEFVVKIPMEKIVMGIGNGWVEGLKFCKVEPSSMKSAHDAAIVKYGQGYLGVMFWTIEEEGSTDNQRMTYLLRREFKDR